MNTLPKTFSKEKNVNAIIETPKGNRNKYCYDPKLGYYKLHKVLPDGTKFPFDFGFIPRTKGEDGDPLDILVLMEELAYPGCLIECRLLGVMEATEKGKGEKKLRNDRLVAVPVCEVQLSTIKTIKDIDKHKLDDFIHFFKYYNQMEDKEFKLLGFKGPNAAMRLIKTNMVR